MTSRHMCTVNSVAWRRGEKVVVGAEKRRSHCEEGGRRYRLVSLSFGWER